MTTPTPNIDRDILVDHLRRWLESQPWWAKYANTATGLVLGGLALAWWLTSTFTELPHWVDALIGAVLFAALVLGLAITPNGLSDSLYTKVIDQVDTAEKSPGPQ
jgi:uncharacterized membrane protein